MTVASANHGQVRSGSGDSICATDAFSDRVTLSQRGRVALVRLSRPEKRNAIDGKMVEAIRAAFDRLPKETCAVVLHGEGDHFCAGADMGELAKRSGLDLMRFSRSLYDVLDRIEYGAVPLLSGSLRQNFPKVAAAQGIWSIRCWGGFDPAMALPDDTGGGPGHEHRQDAIRAAHGLSAVEYIRPDRCAL